MPLENLSAYRNAFSAAFSAALAETDMASFKRCSFFGGSGDAHRRDRGEEVAD